MDRSGAEAGCLLHRPVHAEGPTGQCDGHPLLAGGCGFSTGVMPVPAQAL